jgi:hypothetical protein
LNNILENGKEEVLVVVRLCLSPGVYSVPSFGVRSYCGDLESFLPEILSRAEGTILLF